MQQLELRGLSGDQVTAAINQLKASLQQGALPPPVALVNPTPGRNSLGEFWRPNNGYWAAIDYQEAPTGKYFCTFGTIDPSTGTKQATVCTIHVQLSEPWNTGGAFGTDGKTIYYLHWGKRGGKDEFANRFPGQRATVRWDGHTGEYLVVTALGHKNIASQLGAYIQMRARFRGGGALEETYRSDFEQGVAEAIHDLETRLGGADVPAGVQVGGPSGPLGADVQAARDRLNFLRQLERRLRLDPYLLAAPVERISSSVRADRRRRLRVSIGVSILSTGAGWLLSSLSPASLFGSGQAFFSAVAHLLPWFAH